VAKVCHCFYHLVAKWKFSVANATIATGYFEPFDSQGESLEKLFFKVRKI
jgi:hypothetical protein